MDNLRVAARCGVILLAIVAKVNAGDVVYDLGCGDGRIVITAVRDFGARGVCVDIDPVRIAESRENARQANVIEDLFATDVGDATVVTLFLSPALNLKMRPKLISLPSEQSETRALPEGGTDVERERRRSVDLDS
jgi:ribosomal protein L11 methylase PrmA